MKTHKYRFFNFTDKPFTGYWNGKAYTFKPGVTQYYPRLIARHFAKHLTNQVLIETGKEKYTSPKKPDEVPLFMEIFHKAFIVEEMEDVDNLDIDSLEKPNSSPSMNIELKQREVIDPYDSSSNTVVPPGPPQVLGTEDSDEEHVGDTDESNYHETPEETKSKT